MSAELARLLRAAAPTAGVRCDLEAATRVFGPRPPRPDVARPHRSKAPLLLVPLLVLAGFGLVHPQAGADATSPPPCPGPSIPVPAGAQIARGDTAGIGCLATGVYVDEVITIRLRPTDPTPRRFALGLPGDRLFLGDWDCDGRATAALFRPSTGATLYFDTWSTSAQPSSDANRCRSIG